MINNYYCRNTSNKKDLKKLNNSIESNEEKPEDFVKFTTTNTLSSYPIHYISSTALLLQSRKTTASSATSSDLQVPNMPEAPTFRKGNVSSKVFLFEHLSGNRRSENINLNSTLIHKMVSAITVGDFSDNNNSSKRETSTGTLNVSVPHQEASINEFSTSLLLSESPQRIIEGQEVIGYGLRSQKKIDLVKDSFLTKTIVVEERRANSKNSTSSSHYEDEKNITFNRLPGEILGMDINFDGTSWLVGNVLANSAVERSGIRSGDCILAINGIHLTASYRKKMSTFLNELPLRVTVTLRRFDGSASISNDKDSSSKGGLKPTVEKITSDNESFGFTYDRHKAASMESLTSVTSFDSKLSELSDCENKEFSRSTLGYKIINNTFFKSRDQFLGLSITNDNVEMSNYHQIKKIQTGGAIDNAKCFRVGDYFWSLNNIPLVGISRRELLRTIQDAEGIVNSKVLRKVEDNLTENSNDRLNSRNNVDAALFAQKRMKLRLSQTASYSDLAQYVAPSLHKPDSDAFVNLEHSTLHEESCTDQSPPASLNLSRENSLHEKISPNTTFVRQSSFRNSTFSKQIILTQEHGRRLKDMTAKMVHLDCIDHSTEKAHHERMQKCEDSFLNTQLRSRKLTPLPCYSFSTEKNLPRNVIHSATTVSQIFQAHRNKQENKCNYEPPISIQIVKGILGFPFKIKVFRGRAIISEVKHSRTDASCITVGDFLVSAAYKNLQNLPESEVNDILQAIPNGLVTLQICTPKLKIDADAFFSLSPTREFSSLRAPPDGQDKSNDEDIYITKESESLEESKSNHISQIKKISVLPFTEHLSLLNNPVTETKLLTCNLEKTSADIGFCIRGGLHTATYHQPITISRFLNGPEGTEMSKILCIGDEIIKVNECDFTTISHSTALDFLRHLPPGTAQFVIRRSFSLVNQSIC